MLSNVYLPVAAAAGASELGLMRDLVALADIHCCKVMCSYRGVAVFAKPGDSPIELMRAFRRELAGPVREGGRIASLPPAPRFPVHLMDDADGGKRS